MLPDMENDRQMTDLQLIARALEGFLNGYSRSVAQILAESKKTGKITYESLEKIIAPGEEVQEVLLTLYEWRLLLPRRSSKTLQWDDRVFLPKAGEVFECPRIVQELVAIAAKTGKWMPLDAVATLSKEMSVEPPERASQVAAHLIERAKYGHLSGADIKNACSQSGLKGQEDSVISSFKAVGILSPALGYLPAIKRHMGPLYELNPSLIVEQALKVIALLRTKPFH